MYPDASISQIVEHLKDIPETALLAAWIILHPDDIRHQRIEAYLTNWRHIQIHTTGYTLQEMGLPPGPCYRTILDHLRTVRLNGEIITAEEEQQLLLQLVEECFDGHS